jgi:WhiB family redox-sensing transcriptional regulator
MHARVRQFDSNTSWFNSASCKGKSHLFFGNAAERPQAKVRREAIAAALCAECPVARPCRDFARKHSEHGFWGGESEDARYNLGYLKDPIISRRNKAREKRTSLQSENLQTDS